MKKIKTALFVPAKGNSERIANKNLTILDGEFLFKRKIIQMLECKEVDEVWIDSEDQRIHELVEDLPVKHLHRSMDLANNKTDGHAMFANQTKNTDADIVVQVLCTAPFIDSQTVDTALKKFKESSDTSLVAVTRGKFYEWQDNRPTYGDSIPNSVDLPERIIEAMSFYAVKTGGKPYHRRYTDHVMFWNLTPEQSIDINNQVDLDLARVICAGHRDLKTQQLKMLSQVLSSSMLSDICKEMNIKHFISDKICQLSKGKFLGYAKTLKLQALEKTKKDPRGTEWKGIFEALKSYEFIVPGDVIVVATDVPDKAYFGDLNATFAMRRGAVGVVVDGHTRDVDKVSQMGLPVYAHGSKSDDIRYEGTMETMNTPVHINGVIVRNNDVIFADSDGVICVPQEKWNAVLAKSRETIKKEMSVKLEATFGADPFDVLDRLGTF
jgi:regulator of RNase E activity RraA/CMP-N-acetylneuraminic acid synthetase